MFVAPASLILLSSWVIVKDFRWGYSWEFVGSYRLYIYVIAAVIPAINLFAHKWDRDVALWARRSVFVLIVLVGSWVHDNTSVGTRYVLNQTTVDVIGNLESEAADRYWSAFTERFGDISEFGGIRKLYEAFGGNLAVNQQTIFLNVINEASDEDLEFILEAVDAMPVPLPVGYVLIFVSFVGQVLAYRASGRREASTSPSDRSPSD